ncbi:MAG TPA: protein translocase subunit SecD, partial [Planctomycetota bacterium]|nr:protein translocase subunit SecD [Planctomycetota bacterium]
MMPNPIRWIVFTLLLVAGAVALTFTKGISLGADLEGGTRLVYSLPLEDIKRDDPNATPDEVVRRTLDVMAKRVDSLGLREISIVAHGDDEIVVELPGLSELEVANIKDTITSLGRLEWRIVAGPEDPFHLDQEQKKLADYLDGAAVKARADEWEKLPADRKDIRFWVDLVRAFNAGEGTAGPAPGLRWYVANPGGRSFDKKNLRRLTAVDFHPMRIDEKLDPVRGDRFVFRGEDIAEVRPTRGEKGVVVFFRLVAEKRAAFGEFTGSNVNRFLAVILNDVVDTEARIKSELPGEGIIESGSIGGYAPEEVKALVTVLNTGSLRVKPRLESESRIGASLGEDSIRLGILSSVLSIAATFAFMFVYYRKAGIVAAISILVNGAVLLGVLSLYGATLTLPGIGGFILTLAMAVDSNILIYERIREERDKGRGVDQAVRLGFERAFVTIVDSNLTTLLTSVVLLWIGTGPIKGLGLTLSVGILTTLFAALVFTKAIFAWLLDHKRLPEVRMLRLFKQTPNLRFIRIWKMTVTVSVLTSVAGLVAFLSAPESVYGIDFVGGASARIRLADAITLADARETLAGLPGFGTPDVTPSLGGESSAGGGRYREFVVKGKLSREKREQMKAEPVGKSQEIVDNFRRGIRQVMGPKMVPDPITDLALAPSSASAPSGGSAAGKASLTLHYAGSAVLDDVRARLATSAMLSDVQVAEVPGDPRAVRVTGT